MAAGRIVVPGYQPLLDANGVPIPDGQIFVYANKTTTLATVYADEGLTTPIANPVLANAAGQFPTIWQDDSLSFSVSVSSVSQGPIATFDNLEPSTGAGGGGGGGGGKLNINGDNAAFDLLTNIGAASQEEVDLLPTQAELDAAIATRIPLTQKGQPSGVATLDSSGLVLSSQLPVSGSYKGSWNASTNSPTITSGVGINGDFYIVGTAGTTTIDGISSWGVGDQARFNGTVWQKIATTAAVSSVAGKTGAVTLVPADAGVVAGTGSGQFAAGNDSRITGALQRTGGTLTGNIAGTGIGIPVGAENLIVNPYANGGDPGRPGGVGQTRTSLNLFVSGVSAAEGAYRHFPLTVSVDWNRGYNEPYDAHMSSAYFDVKARAGSGAFWALNTVCDHITNDWVDGHGYELDYNMTSPNQYGAVVGPNGLSELRNAAGGLTGKPNVSNKGMSITGISFNGGTLMCGLLVASATPTPLFQRGIVTGAGIKQEAWGDYSQAQYVLRDWGSHTVGIDLSPGTYSDAAIRLRDGIKIRSLPNLSGGTAAHDLIYGDGARQVHIGGTNTTAIIAEQGITLPAGQSLKGGGGTYDMLNMSGNIMRIGQGATGGMLFYNTAAPFADNAYSMGGPSNRWTAVYAVNGTIQTSDPALKTDISPIPEDRALRLLDAIDPITFRWIEGGRETVASEDGADPVSFPVEGKRTHWGWNAEQIGAAFEEEGVDFGGYVVTPDGTKNLRPDQLVPILWAALKSMKKRLDDAGI